MHILVAKEKDRLRCFTISDIRLELDYVNVLRKLFRERQQNGWYDKKTMNKTQLGLYKRALSGNPKSFMLYRDLKRFEYETFNVVKAEDYYE